MKIHAAAAAATANSVHLTTALTHCVYHLLVALHFLYAGLHRFRIYTPPPHYQRRKQHISFTIVLENPEFDLICPYLGLGPGLKESSWKEEHKILLTNPGLEVHLHSWEMKSVPPNGKIKGWRWDSQRETGDAVTQQRLWMRGQGKQSDNHLRHASNGKTASTQDRCL